MDKKNIISLWRLFCQTVTLCVAVLLIWRGFGETSPSSYGDAIGRVLASVPGIYGRTTADISSAAVSPDGIAVGADSIGAGVIVDERHILTNYHIVANMNVIEAKIGGDFHSAELVGVNPEIDIAVLRVSGILMSPLTFADDATLRPGDVVFAVGNPFGLSRSASMGIVSAVGRNDLGINRQEDFIQTDAAINPGSSGGALINTAGELVGINSALFSRYSGGVAAQGIGFAVPVEVIRRSLEDFLLSRLPDNPLGAEVRPMSSRLHREVLSEPPPYTPVMLVSRVWEGTPADKMGMMPGDIVWEIDDLPAHALSESGELPLSLQNMVVLRGGKPRRLSLSAADSN